MGGRARSPASQVATEAKSNEITAIPVLLDALDIRGATVTIDAEGCQKKIAKKIVDQGGNYLLALKGNQPLLHQEVIAYFEHVPPGTSGTAGPRALLRRPAVVRYECPRAGDVLLARTSGVVAKLKGLDHLVTKLCHGDLLGWSGGEAGVDQDRRDRGDAHATRRCARTFYAFPPLTGVIGTAPMRSRTAAAERLRSTR
ncbi:MAG: ISAs1 family transposase [Polyangiaceae bacterium]|nr:ISAs1 family transposase [Polyangiaceae bacterium]